MGLALGGVVVYSIRRSLSLRTSVLIVTCTYEREPLIYEFVEHLYDKKDQKVKGHDKKMTQLTFSLGTRSSRFLLYPPEGA